MVHTSVISVLGKLKLEHHQFEVSLDYRASSRPARTIYRWSQNNNNKTKHDTTNKQKAEAMPRLSSHHLNDPDFVYLFYNFLDN
jgi:hypothetical protein